MIINVERVGPVAVLRWDDGENRVNLDSIGRLNEILDELESIEGPLAIVLTGSGKFFSNGLDLDRFGHVPDEFFATITAFNRTVGRLLVFPAYSVAAINGHAFAAGALLSCAFDQRVMREDRGYWCMNEADIGLALDEPLWSILTNRLPRSTATLAATTARRFSGPDAVRYGIVEEAVPEDTVLARSIQIAESMASTNRVTLGAHKRLAHGDEAAHLGFEVGS